MSKYITIKEYLSEVELFTRRILVLFAGIFLMSLLLLGRLFNLQVLEHDRYTTASKQNLLKIMPIEPKRGLIYDREHRLLAENIPVFNLEIVRSSVRDIKDTITKLQTILPISQTEIDTFYKIMRHRRRYDSVPLKIKLTEAEIAKFYVNRHLFPGVDIQARLIRHYPKADQLAHVVGYVGRIGIRELSSVDASEYSATNYIGKVGVEKYYENMLHGHVGYQRVETDASGKVFRVLERIAPEAGDDITLTLDSHLQHAAMRALKGKRGAVVAIEPSSGQVLAMVSMPSYDPNPFVTGLSTDSYNSLQNSADNPLYNRAIHAAYPPASTIKPFLALGGLFFHIIYPSRKIKDLGWYRVEDSPHIYHDWKPGGHGFVNLFKAIVVSCDTYFFDLAYHMGISRIDETLRKFGFGEQTGIDMPEELSGLLPTKAWKLHQRHVSWFKGDTINSGIGQGFMLSTPLQLAVATSTLATRGQRYQPTVLLKTRAADGNITVQQPIAAGYVDVKDSTWDIIYKAMIGVIQNRGGTGFRFGKHAPYTAAAKTGTAQVASKRTTTPQDLEDIPERLRDHSLFIVFAPVEKPEIALAVVVEHDPRRAVIVARQILDYYFGHKPSS